MQVPASLPYLKPALFLSGPYLDFPEHLLGGVGDEGEVGEPDVSLCLPNLSAGDQTADQTDAGCRTQHRDGVTDKLPVSTER